MNGRWIAIAAIWLGMAGMGSAVALTTDDNTLVGLALLIVPIFAVAGTIVVASIAESRTYKVKGKNLPQAEVARIVDGMEKRMNTEPGAP